MRVLGEGPPAVLWHSLFVDDRSWQRVEDDLARDRRLVIITGPGLGESSDPGHRHSIDDGAAAAGAVLAALDITGSVDWVGNAWGARGSPVRGDLAGPVSAACHVRDADRVLRPLERLQVRALLAIYRVVGMRDFLSSGIVDALLPPRTRADDPEAVALVLDGLRTMGRRALANAMVSVSTRRPDLTPRLAAVRCPTVFVTGSDLPDWVPDLAAAKSRLLANGSVAVIPGTAYLTPLEAPEQTVQIVRTSGERRNCHHRVPSASSGRR